MPMTRATRTTRLLAALAAVSAVAAFAGSPAASAAPAATMKATSKCWLQVVNDWLNHGTVKGTYAIPCYTQAVQQLSNYPDIKQYSSAIDDINRAKLIAIHQQHGNGPDGASLGGGNGPSGGGGPSGGSGPGGGGPSGGTAATHKSILSKFAADIGPGNAQSIPLPLLVLGGLALLLLLTAAATWFARRLQARRVTPAPAVAKRR